MLGFRRRCAWCGVQLRWWQLNLCRTCRPSASGDAGIYLLAGGPPCSEGSRWDAVPDGLRSTKPERPDNLRDIVFERSPSRVRYLRGRIERGPRPTDL